MSDAVSFWEARARRFAGEGRGLRAICSYAMPAFYNWSIDVTQRRAMRALLHSIEPGMRVLDFGCGVGRWSRELAQRGALVTGVDLSENMLIEARRRTCEAGLSERCTYVCGDVAQLELDAEFDLILGVTVLQHVLDEGRMRESILRMARRLRAGGRIVLLEAAPTRAHRSADTATFHARTLATYVDAIRNAGLYVEDICGVDPAPFKLWVVPRFRRWPRIAALAALAVATICALPVDLLAARLLTRSSWHKIIVCRASGESP
jgi:2-polyprenyl-3-methyl-5-hydroxy-6-metoxy-1,4-benzoquinol methylase